MPLEDLKVQLPAELGLLWAVSLYLIHVYEEQVLGIVLTNSTPTRARKYIILLSIKI